ncbi:MAG: hypothetical protein EXS36_05690 [Pedosphaera sp.]|nr:hypothetical protein [Pedosphaera sp.]
MSGNTLYGTALGSVYTGSPRSDRRLSGAVFKLHTDGTGFRNLHNFETTGIAKSQVNRAISMVLSGSTLYGATFQGRQS